MHIPLSNPPICLSKAYEAESLEGKIRQTGWFSPDESTWDL